MSDSRRPRHHRLSSVWAIFQGGEMGASALRLDLRLERWRSNQHYGAIARTTHA